MGVGGRTGVCGAALHGGSKPHIVGDKAVLELTVGADSAEARDLVLALLDLLKKN